MCDPYRITRGLDARFDEIDDAGCTVKVGRGSGGGWGAGGDFPPVWYWCEITCPDGRRVSGTGDSKETAFGAAARNV